jgi:integrase
MSNKPRLLDQVREALRLRHYSYRTEKQYVGWIRRFILFHGRRHPAELGGLEVESFLSHLASRRHVAAATQAQALASLLFLYKHVLRADLPWLSNVVRATRPRRIPVVLTRSEIRAVLACLTGTWWIIASLLYGSGLRLTEALRLRVKDVNFDQRLILVRDGKGAKDVSRCFPKASPIHFGAKWRKFASDTASPCSAATVELIYLTRLIASIRGPTWKSVGNTSFPRTALHAIRAAVPGAVIT